MALVTVIARLVTTEFENERRCLEEVILPAAQANLSPRETADRWRRWAQETGLHVSPLLRLSGMLRSAKSDLESDGLHGSPAHQLLETAQNLVWGVVDYAHRARDAGYLARMITGGRDRYYPI